MRSVSGAKKAATIWIQPLRRKFSTVRAPERLKKSAIPEPTSRRSRKQYGGAHLSDEELLFRFYAGPEFVDALKTAPPRKIYMTAQTIVRLVEELGKKKLAHVYIRKGEFSLTIQR